MLLCSEKVLVRSSFHAASSETLLWTNEFNWLFMPSFFTYHVACSTFEWDYLQRLKLVDFWGLGGSTLSWVHKSLAEMKVISKRIVPRMVLNSLYGTALLLPHIAPLWLFCHLHFEPRFRWAGLPVPLFSLWEKRVCARKHHRFRCSLSRRYGFVFLWLLVSDAYFTPKSISTTLCASLPGRWIGK